MNYLSIQKITSKYANGMILLNTVIRNNPIQNKNDVEMCKRLIKNRKNKKYITHYYYLYSFIIYYNSLSRN